MSPGSSTPHPHGVARGREPLARAGPRICCLPQVRLRVGPAGRGRPRAAVPLWLTASSLPPDARDSAGQAHCPGRLRRGRAGLQGRGALMVGSRNCRYLISFLRACPTPLPGSPRSATRLCRDPPLVPRALASSSASHPCRLGGRSRVNIARREPFAARRQGRSRKEDPFRSRTPGGFLVS